MAKTKISEMVVGNTYDVPLVVTAAQERKTRAGKLYLTMTLYDGVDTIQCNYWDWSSGSMPKTNTVYDFKVECSEYMGKKQLTCKAVRANTTDMLEDFMPQGTVDVAKAYMDFYAMCGDIKDDFFRTISLHLAEELKEYWLHVPGAVSVHHNFMGGTLVHSLSVAKIATAMASQIEGAWVDLVCCGALLHDLGKLFTYKLDGVTINYTEDGQFLDHLFIGAEFVGNQCEQFIHTDMDELKLQLLRHIILSHHGKKEFGSTVTPKCLEAWVVHYADMMDATAEVIRTESRKAGDKQRWTEKIWMAENSPHFTTQAIAALSTKPYEPGTPEMMRLTADQMNIVEAW